MNTNELDTGLKEIVEHGIELRRRAHDLATEAKALDAAANDLLLEALPQIKDKSASVPGQGTVTLVSTTRKRLNADDFKFALVEAGMSAEVIKECADANTKTTLSTSVRIFIIITQAEIPISCMLLLDSRR